MTYRDKVLENGLHLAIRPLIIIIITNIIKAISYVWSAISEQNLNWKLNVYYALILNNRKYHRSIVCDPNYS